jgi:phosphotransferase system HPr-like phosphotransfer protein
MQIAGVITNVFDNRLAKDGTASKYPNYKFQVGNQQVTLWSAILHPAIAKGKKVSVICQASKKTGALFVASKPDKSPMIQELPADDKPDTSFNPDELEAELQSVAKTFDADLTVETKKPFNKDEYMFVMALAKSIIESGKVNVNKEEVDLLIKDLKFLFKVNFGN